MILETISIEKAGRIATITLNRPTKLNALNNKMAEELPKALNHVAADDVDVVVITGAGRAFSAGADLQERFIDRINKIGRGEIDFDQEQTFTDVALPIIKRIEKPIIASINGHAIGFGCSLAFLCDIRIASENARLGLGFIRVGLTPDLGMTYLLPRLVGISRSLELFLTGRMLDAREAKEMGLVNQVVPADRLMTATYEIARSIADSPPMAVRLTKKGIYQGVDADLNTQLQWERSAINTCYQTEDHLEGARAILEKREPKFRGR